MSDYELRRMEKRLSENPDDLNLEVSCLRLRLRSGLLSQKRLNAAVLFKSKAAALAGGRAVNRNYSKPNTQDGRMIGMLLRDMRPNNPVYYLARYCYGIGMSRSKALLSCYHWMNYFFRYHFCSDQDSYDPDSILAKAMLSSEW